MTAKVGLTCPYPKGLIQEPSTSGSFVTPTSTRPSLVGALSAYKFCSVLRFPVSMWGRGTEEEESRDPGRQDNNHDARCQEPLHTARHEATVGALERRPLREGRRWAGTLVRLKQNPPNQQLKIFSVRATRSTTGCARGFVSGLPSQVDSIATDPKSSTDWPQARQSKGRWSINEKCS